MELVDVADVDADVVDEADDAVEAAELDEVLATLARQPPAVQASPGLHTLLHRPQLAESFVKLTQTAPHFVSG